MRKYIFLKKNINQQSGFSTIQIILLVLGSLIIIGGITGGVIYFSRQPGVQQIQQGFCGDGICGVVEKERNICMEDCEVNTATISAPTQNNDSLISINETIGDNSFDADGFLWGTEVYPAYFSTTEGVVKNTMKIKNLKTRLQEDMFIKDGKNFTSKYCLPSASNCIEKHDEDEAVAVFKNNKWSMLPMFSYKNNSSVVITDADIEEYVSFVDWFVSKYKNDASIKYIELINAPGGCTKNSCFWTGTLAQLVNVNNKVYDRIKSKYPDVLIGTPGFEYWLDSSDSDESIKIIEYFLDKNNGAKFDFWAFHGYPAISKNNLSAGISSFYPPTKSSMGHKYASVNGILEIRKKMDANGWQNRLIMDMEHTGINSTKPMLTQDNYRIDAAYMVQELIIKKTLTYNDKTVLSGIVSLKMIPRGGMGEMLWGSLNSDSSINEVVKAIALLVSKLNDYKYNSHLSGEFDNETKVWVEKFSSENKELYIFFKPFEYKSGQNIAFDNKTAKYTLTLNKKTSKITLTDTYGATSSVTPAASVTIEAVNAPKFLEVEY